MMVPTPIPTKIFLLPVPRHIFFPYTQLSLHIPISFYNRMKQEGEPWLDFLGVVFSEGEPMDDSAILPVGCIGKVLSTHELPCKKAIHADLYGLGRFNVREVSWQKEYHYGVASIDLIETKTEYLNPRGKELLDGLLLGEKGLIECPEEVQNHIKNKFTHDAYLNYLCHKAKLSFAEKYFLFEAGGINQRCGRLLDLLKFKLEDISNNSL